MDDALITPTWDKIDSRLTFNIIQRELLYFQNYNKEKDCLLAVFLEGIIDYTYFNNERALEMLKESSDNYIIDLEFNIEKQRKLQDMIVKILESETISNKDFTKKFYEVIKQDGTINGVEKFLNSYLKGGE